MKSFMKRRESQYVAAKHVAVGRLVMIVAAACLCLALTEAATRAQTSDAKGEGTMGVVMVTTSSADAVRQLTSRDALVRKRAAEDLARMADTEQRRLVEGYRLQEKDGRVRVALDWALYRMGKAEALYNLVRALDSSRFDQASVYLGELETPEPLYIFLERTNGNTQIKLLQVLAHMGDAATLARIKPLADSLDPLIAQAAREAAHDITTRLAETPPATPATPARPRQTRNRDEDEHAEETSPQQ